MDGTMDPETPQREVYEELRPLLFSIAYGIVSSVSEAEDLRREPDADDGAAGDGQSGEDQHGHGLTDRGLLVESTEVPEPAGDGEMQHA